MQTAEKLLSRLSAHCRLDTHYAKSPAWQRAALRAECDVALLQLAASVAGKGQHKSLKNSCECTSINLVIANILT